MELSSLTAISPLDGRYADKLAALRPLFSEYGLMNLRLRIEVAWLKALAEEPSIEEISLLSEPAIHLLDQLVENFHEQDAKRIKNIEKTTQHDVKAIEYFLKEKIHDHPELASASEFIHFACTSEDINNLAYAMALKIARHQFILPHLDDLITVLVHLAHQYAALPMLARTHGQPATPTTLGKEIANIVARLRKQIDHFNNISILGKINGAIGNFNAHMIAYPEVNWPQFAKTFVEKLEIEWNPYTTQIEPHDYIAEFCHAMIRMNTILIDLNRDLWGYISIGYFKQKTIEGEVGSSTMPHKINPIHFENAEGNLGMANAVLDFLARQLPTSRWQRDLVDSTLLRNLGVGIGHALLAYQSTYVGLQKIEANPLKMEADLENSWEVLGEAVQTVMRRYGIEKPYEQLKTLTRGKPLDAKTLHAFINNLELPASVKKTLCALTPATYVGNAEEMGRKV